MKKGTKKCEGCGRYHPKDDMIYGPDPYNHDVFGDETPVWLCKKCYDVFELIRSILNKGATHEKDFQSPEKQFI